MSKSSHHDPAALSEPRSLGASWVICTSRGFSISGGGEVINTDNCGTLEGKETGRFGKKGQGKNLNDTG